MNIQSHLDKNNLHHAYLIEGSPLHVVPQIFSFVENLGIKTSGNPDFCHIAFDIFKIDDARDLKSKGYEKSFSNNKKVFVISANNLLLEAQNALLKVFEEPIQDTHFFLIVPNTNFLLKTLVSRFYLIKNDTEPTNDQQSIKEAEIFIKMDHKGRLDFIKNMLAEIEDDAEAKDDDSNFKKSSKSRPLEFLNALESILHDSLSVSKCLFDTGVFSHLFKVREFLNQPGSSVKNLMESVALTVPRLA